MMVDRAFGLYEYWKTEWLKRIVRPGMSCVDVGANKGDFTLLMAALTGADGRVLSFEPDPENFRWLARTVSEGSLSHVKLSSVALSDHEGEAIFYPGKKSGWGTLRVDAARNSEERAPLSVQLRKLDDVLEGEADVIKIDVEGTERDVLRGALRTVRSPRLTVVMDLDSDDARERAETFALLEDAGFRLYRIGAELSPVDAADPGHPEILATKVELP
jgi:FkbM family methyltransferase